MKQGQPGKIGVSAYSRREVPEAMQKTFVHYKRKDPAAKQLFQNIVVDRFEQKILRAGVLTKSCRRVCVKVSIGL